MQSSQFDIPYKKYYPTHIIEFILGIDSYEIDFRYSVGDPYRYKNVKNISAVNELFEELSNIYESQDD